MTKTVSKFKHNYTSELELKSLLIRIKNKKQELHLSEKNNSRINKYISYYVKINSLKTVDTQKKSTVKKRIKGKIIKLSEQTNVDNSSFERFGEIILLMIKNILRKPSFSGYSYEDDFYSDAVYKILKYLCNFDHNLISKRLLLQTNKEVPVNAFAYVSQIIHNSIVYIIKTKKSESKKHKKYVSNEYFSKANLKGYDWYLEGDLLDKEEIKVDEEISEIIKLKYIKTTLLDKIKSHIDDIEKSKSIIFYYPSDYRISFQEYNDLKPYLKGKASIVRSTDE